MGTGVFDANGILRVGPDLEGATVWRVVGPIDDTDTPYAAEASDFIVVGNLGDDLEITLPTEGLRAGDQIAVKLFGNPDGHTVEVNGDGINIDDAGFVNLTVAYQQLYVVYLADDDGAGSPGWAILESGEGVAEVFSVFAATGNVLPNASVSGNSLDLGPGGFTAATTVFNVDNTGNVSALTLNAHLTGSSDDNRYVGQTAAIAPVAGLHSVGDWVTTTAGRVFVCSVAGTPGTWVEVGANMSTTTTVPQLITTQAAAPADGTLAASQVTFWLDATNGAPVFHIKAKQANGTVVGAAIPLT